MPPPSADRAAPCVVPRVVSEPELQLPEEEEEEEEEEEGAGQPCALPAESGGAAGAQQLRAPR